MIQMPRRAAKFLRSPVVSTFIASHAGLDANIDDGEIQSGARVRKLRAPRWRCSSKPGICSNLDSWDADAPSFRQPRLGYNFPAEKL
jgi:hypothetical protein